MLKALSREFRSECPEELFYVDDLILVIEIPDSLKRRLETWKLKLKSKGLKVNVMKTKVMISSKNTGKVSKEAKFCCTVHSMGVGSNLFSVSFTTGCMSDAVILKIK